ncbi:MAG: 3-deoxy-D-manno-octulosonic acid kinase, partial [Pseudomonadota bacterium]
PASGGRGAAWFVNIGDHQALLRHYCRGGLAAKLSRDRFVYTGLSRTRPWREWLLNQYLFDCGLAVPRPLAAGVNRRGLSYQAAFVTARLPDAVSLADALRKQQSIQWARLAQTVSAFHQVGLDHVDLNANNLLLSQGDWHLIDFDKCRLRRFAAAWSQANCARLKRSLVSLDLYDESGWRAFVDAYTASIASR